MQLVYVSAAARVVDAPEIETLESRSRANNDRLGITGFLLHQGGFFYGVLEGPQRRVFDLMEVIITDRRHHSLRILREEAVASRRFENWTLGSLPSAGTLSASSKLPDDFILKLSERLR